MLRHAVQFDAGPLRRPGSPKQALTGSGAGQVLVRLIALPERRGPMNETADLCRSAAALPFALQLPKNLKAGEGYMANCEQTACPLGTHVLEKGWLFLFAAMLHNSMLLFMVSCRPSPGWRPFHITTPLLGQTGPAKVSCRWLGLFLWSSASG